MTLFPKENTVFAVGLTGGIGSGKSAVANEFHKLGILVIDADQASRQVVEPGSAALEAIAEHFGKSALQADGTLNRSSLRQKIFTDPSQRHWLEALLHPLIQQLILDSLCRATGPYTILESPLLLETNQHTLVDRVLVIDVPEEVQLLRATQRDNSSEAQIRAIIDSQINRQKRLALADDVLDNSGPIGDLTDAVLTLHSAYLRLARRHKPDN